MGDPACHDRKFRDRVRQAEPRRLSAGRALVLTAGLLLALGAAGRAEYSCRVICGNTSTAYTDSHGYSWSPDRAYTEGNWGFLGPENNSVAQFPTDVIENSYDAPLYRSERLDQGYRFDVPAPGKYFVKFLWAENYWGSPKRWEAIGSRVFDVFINGQPVVIGLDILARTGGRAFRALVETAEVTVPEGVPPYSIIIQVSVQRDKAKFSAIEVSDQLTLTDVTADNAGRFAAAAPEGEEAFRINCGGKRFVDATGRLWMADESFSQCQRWGYLGGQAVANTPAAISDTLDPGWTTYRTSADGGGYRMKVPNGSYQVKFGFLEPVHRAPGLRVFDVLINGAPAAAGLDIFARAGTAPLWVERTVQVADETLDIRFANVTAGTALLNLLEARVLHVPDTAFLDFVERRTLDFFTVRVDGSATVNPANGLITDRAPNFSPIDHWPSNCSIAAVGFGLAALAVGADRGWLDRGAAQQQVLAALTSFDRAQVYVNDAQNSLTHRSGFYFHFLDMDSGKRAGGSEVSSIDSALLFAGIRTAAAYFSDPQVQALAERLLSRADWDWFSRTTPQRFVANHWLPESGFPSYAWSGYNEDVLMDILGLGSTSSPLETSCWLDMTRVWQSEGDLLYQIEVANEPTGLFTHIYPQCFLDLRSLTDGKNNYFQNTVKAAQVNRGFTAGQSAAHPTYADGGWCLSASDSPRWGTSYYAYRPRPGQHDGTVNVAIQGATVPFWPQTAIASLRRTFFRYKHQVWGRFGFASAYNLSAPRTFDLTDSGQGWVSPDAIGIDAGALLLALENHRSGLVWRLFSQVPDVRRGLARAGFGDPVLDSFDHDRSAADETGHRDGSWSTNRADHYTLDVVPDTRGNTTACLRIRYTGLGAAGNGEITVGGLSRPGNLTYLAEAQQFSARVRGRVQGAFQWEDELGRRSAFSPLFTADSSGYWEAWTWDLAGTDWGTCDPKRLDRLHLSLSASAAADGELYLDDLSMAPAAWTGSVPRTVAGGIIAYPNPGGDRITFALRTEGGGAVDGDIYNLSGERVATLRAAVAEPVTVVRWEAAGAAVGVYVVRLRHLEASGKCLATFRTKVAIRR